MSDDETFDLVLRDVRLVEGEGAFDIGVEGGLIRRVALAGSLSGRSEIDAAGRLCSGAFVDGHVHLDKSYLSELPCFGTKVAGAFFDELKTFKMTSTFDTVSERMRRAAHTAILNGTGTLRAQIDVDDVVGLTHLQAALALRDELAPLLRLQIVVFPQEGLVGNAAAAEVVREALRLGADVMGGGHGFDRSVTPGEHYGECFALAREFDVDVDLHLDFDATPDWPLADWDVAQVARLTAEHGMQGRVTVAHLSQHGQLSESGKAELAELLVSHDISLTIVPGPELQGARFWTDRPTEDVREATADYAALVRAGVRLGCASGHFADAFHPHGEGDLLRETLLLVSARNLGDPTIGGVPAFSLATSAAAHICGLPGPHGTVPGALADLVIFDAPDAPTAIRRQADRWLVVHNGIPVARTRTSKELIT